MNNNEIDVALVRAINYVLYEEERGIQKTVQIDKMMIVGFVVEVTTEFVRVAPEHTPNGENRTVIRIPNENVKKITCMGWVTDGESTTPADSSAS